MKFHLIGSSNFLVMPKKLSTTRNGNLNFQMNLIMQTQNFKWLKFQNFLPEWLQMRFSRDVIVSKNGFLESKWVFEYNLHNKEICTT